MNVKNGHWGLLQLFWYTAHSQEMCPLHVFVFKKIAFNNNGFLQIFSFRVQTKNHILTKFPPNVNFVSKCMHKEILKTIPCFGKKIKYEVLILTNNQLQEFLFNLS